MAPVYALLPGGVKFSPAALYRALVNIRKWGQAYLDEDVDDDDLEIVHDEDLFGLGFIDYPEPMAGPAKLTPKGVAWMLTYELQK